MGDNEMQAAQMGGQTLTSEQLHAKRWAIHAMPPLPQAPVFNPDAGFCKAFRLQANAWLGSPITTNEDTVTFPDGTTAPSRVMTNAVVFWAPDGLKVLE